MTNRRKFVCYIAQSLDGYIAAENDSLEWLFKVEGEGDAGYSEFMETIDTVVLGRRTYDWIMQMEKGQYPYKGLKSYVFSRSRPAAASEEIEFINMEIPKFTENLKNISGKNVWLVGGADLLANFLEAGAVDEFIISIAPVLIGNGIPLFQKQHLLTEYKLKDIKRYGEFAQLHYELK